ncbi:hypothetical protein BN126_1770 [Cronobacter sakazakii 680]|nr:hypothetical protein BN126_1770 [Cronobacter sakazakii 680]
MNDLLSPDALWITTFFFRDCRHADYCGALSGAALVDGAR